MKNDEKKDPSKKESGKTGFYVFLILLLLSLLYFGLLFFSAVNQSSPYERMFHR
ncbi:hypothetical protein [Methylacidiphilum sp. Yel]|jgi:hypothetical protein|uniref:Uncharacterized protein n=1 Tax=Methylacidiphilum kamchatkense Kam1 TaxID=1202785 RepID=A0A516TMT6_9BACT|nr:hypothetical protein [Methylacidiphilum sp. Yel]QDQ42545.1 hypothetical protein kam1_1320 [Methylacidiphilum kamchatkense Kam1]